MFNALRYIRRLEEVGFPREQAEAQVQLVMDSYEENVATKSDLSEVRSEISSLRSEMRSGMAEVRSEIAGLRSEMQSEMAEVRSEMIQIKAELKSEISAIRVEISSLDSKLSKEIANLKNDLLVKLGGVMVASISIATGVLGVLIKF